MRVPCMFLFMAPTMGFVVIPSQTRTGHSMVLFQENSRTSWPKYEHDYVDPLTPHKVESKVEDHMDRAKREMADEYWMKQAEIDKERLHELNVKAHQLEDNEVEAHPTESFAHYKHANLDPITPHHHDEEHHDYMTPEQRAAADKYWLELYRQEKDKMHVQQKKTP